MTSQVFLVGFFNVAAGVSGLILGPSGLVLALSCLNLILGTGALLCLFMITKGIKGREPSASAG